MYIEFVRYLERVTRAMYFAWSLVGIKALKSLYTFVPRKIDSKISFCANHLFWFF